jgi:hypothetical protein
MWLDPIPAGLRDRARAELEKGNVIGFLCTASNEHSLDSVYFNLKRLKRLGLFESALLQAFTATRTNNKKWATQDLRDLLREADRIRLRSAGDPLPGPRPFTVYRGVGGRRSARRVRGFSWSDSLDTAKWFADRAGGWGLHDPAVYCISVNESDVLS